ncbi:hypothetical protein ACFFKC_08510 [Pseudoduganella danionis]|uniref:Uncharacterized protein n=1 Tax=Pseudoduganella danionis TaxID=1890295 RepID=A0ABW9STE5_9BURK|nr:hypothetical protein [Pseudoduganella danionis]MTW34881.1 hypothetical protein [Pseudoduganella danionis]
MKTIPIVIAMLVGFASIALANSTMLQVGESFVKAQARLIAAGWQADPHSHLASGEYMGLDRMLVQSGYSEVDYCSVGKSLCVLQYIKGNRCLRVHTQGEEIRSMKVEMWSNDCRERGADEQGQKPPADVRYLAQWKNDCENYGQCRGIDAYFLKLKKKYRQDHEIMTILNAE